MLPLLWRSFYNLDLYKVAECLQIRIWAICNLGLYLIMLKSFFIIDIIITAELFNKSQFCLNSVFFHLLIRGNIKKYSSRILKYFALIPYRNLKLV